MPDTKSVSPLLDGFTIGTPVNEHFGVCCYPAVKAGSERKYIVKMISIPASQTQLDALLITGAYKDPAEAAEYFRTLTSQVVQEVEFLKSMSRKEGFIPFEGIQVEPMQKNRLGYEIYLLSGFRLSLERYMHRQTVTHLEAVNLGIDLCTALAACRESGRMYIALKPSNIFVSTKKEYKIGDLGFVPLSSLKYSSMPEKYRSCYTAPELQDDLAVLNTTADTYSAGMILYQIFNGGALPEDPASPLPPPANADEQMASILLKACAPDPADRWEDPGQMRDALIAYLQSETVNNTPIMEPISKSSDKARVTHQTAAFPVPEQEQQEAPSASVPEAEPSEADGTAEPDAAGTDEAEAEPESAAEEASSPAEHSQELPEEAPSDAADDIPVPADQPEAEPVMDAPQTSDEAPEEPLSEEPPAVSLSAPEAEEEYASQDIFSASQEDTPEEQPFSDAVTEFPQEFTAIDDGIEAAAAAEFDSLTMSSDPAGQPLEVMDEERLDRELENLSQLLRNEKPLPTTRKLNPNIEPVVIRHKKKKSSVVRPLVIVLTFSLLLACCIWGYMFYETEYLKTIRALSVDGTLDEITVTLDTDIADNLLTVVCSDTYGHSTRQRVRDGKATFQQLSPASLYKIQVEISGVHKLVGQTSDIFTTESVTSVAAFSASVGQNDGSVVLTLLVEGHEPDQWQVIYTAEGEPELGQTFTGHSATIENLVIGKTYTFRLETAKHEAVNGQTTTEFTATRLVAAKDLSVVSCSDGVMTVQWDSDRAAEAEGWKVRCTGANYDETIECTELQASFSGISTAESYTVEVTAKGMSQTARINVSPNPVTLTELTVSDSDPMSLALSWSFEGNAPESGWLVQYTLDNSTIPNMLKCEDAQIAITPRIPGAVYHFSIQTADDTTVFNSEHSFACPPASGYAGHGLAGSQFTCRLLTTPEDENWSYNASDLNFTETFSLGQSISAVVYCPASFYLHEDPVSVLYVFRDESGNALIELIGEQELVWKEIWNASNYHNGELDIPVAPIKAGSYTLDIYFDGMFIATAPLTVY